jgi:DNA-directed RNA polymerase specialized sigma24 family protein
MARKNNKDKGENYVAPADLRKELIIYRKDGVITEKFGEMVLKIARRYSSIQKFSSYSYRDEFISDAAYRIIQQIDKLDPDKNCFAYVTKICYHCFVNRINKEKRFGNIKNKYKIKIFEKFEKNEKINYQTPDEEDDHEMMYDYFLNSEKYYSDVNNSNENPSEED